MNTHNMAGMQHMPASNSFACPQWLLLMLAALFAAGACFYLLRLLQPALVKRVYGYWDWQNEVGHGLCMLAMAGMLAPAVLPLSGSIWFMTLGAAGSWFLVRALTWGRRLPYNKWWYDWAHVGMLYGMALMFYPVALGIWFTILQIGFWGWFACYYLWQIAVDLRAPKVLYLGSDFCHAGMAATMLLMTMFPWLLMPATGNHHHGISASDQQPAAVLLPASNPADRTAPPAPVAHSGVFVVDDANFIQEVSTHRQPVVVLVFGGCERCAQEAHIFDELALQFAGRIKFARLNKDESPQTCRLLGVKECPAIVFVSTGGVARQAKLDVTDKEALRAFIEQRIN